MQATSGGNPGSYLALTQRSVSPVGSVVNILGGHLYLAREYRPATEGAIGTMDVSFDAISIDSFAGAVAYAALVHQAGTDFVLFGGQAINGAGWINFSLSGLVAEAFSAVTATGFDATRHPDFSAAGAALMFGFAASNGTFGDSTNNGGVDNWRVSIHGATPVPVPGAALLFASALTLLASRRQSR